MSELYSVSGRTDWFEFEQLSSLKSVTSKPEGLIQGVTGGQLTWDYTTDTLVSGNLEVADTPMLHSKYIRVYYVSKIPVKTSTGVTLKKYRALLGTCYADTENGHLENKKYSGTINLQGTMIRYLDDKISKTITLKKDSSIVAFIEQIFKWYGGDYAIQYIKDRKVSSTRVWDFGTSPYDILCECASWLNGYITTDLQGKTCIRPVIAPGNRGIDYTIPMGEESVVLPGVDITSTIGSSINRVAVKYVKNEKYKEGNQTKTRQIPIYGLASLAPTNAASKQKTGRFITHTETLNSLKPETAEQANATAKKLLSSNSGSVTEYKFTSYYLPIWCNSMVRFKYENIDIDALVVGIDYELSVGCKMTVTLRKIRNHKK